ncbi:hypothetical protein BDR26DRAFT_876596 [Obelidium mucronatum]|nr:hypothetical protein BDR26DRAFT_876596 [Obelidium mucronatum]
MHSVGLLEGPPYACSNWALEAAALNGSLPVLEWLHENVALFSAENSKKISLKSAIDGAAGRGHLHVVQWLHCNRRDGASTWAVDRAAGSGYLDKHRSEGGTTQAATLASLNGHLHVLQWLHKNTEIAINSSETYQNSIRGGHIHILEYLYSLQKSNEPANLLETAWTHNRFEIIQFLFLQHPNLTISPNALKNAFRSQNTTLFLDLFEKATKQQATLLQERAFQPIFTELWNIVGTTGSQASLQLLKSLQIPGISNSEVLTKAAENGHLELVRELIYTEKMTPPDPMSLRAAAANGHLRIVKMLSPLIQDVAANEIAIVEAARRGNLKIVEWLDRNIALEFRSNHVYSLISVVAEYGFLDIVQFLHVHKGAVCITRAMDRAAMSNHLHIIKYLTEICGATCSQWALNDSAKYGYLHIVKYLLKHHRTECDTIAFRYAVESGRINVVKFFLENEFVWEVGRNGDLVDLAVKNWHWKVQRLLVHHGF